MQFPSQTAPAPSLRVVHYSYGRLRIHLADPDGQISACLRWLPGVTSAEANELTGNLLILFNPEQITRQALDAELQARCANVPVAPSLALIETEAYHPRPIRYATGARRRLYEILGWSS